MRILAQILVVSAAALLLLACSTPVGSASPEASPIEGRTWTLVELLDQPVGSGEHGPAPHLLLEPEGSRASGSGGCNRFTGSYSIDGDRIRVGPFAVTRRSCAHGMARERTFLEVLPRATRWRRVGEQLSLSDPEGRVVARFEVER
jgi:heat shock protein HslJ